MPERLRLDVAYDGGEFSGWAIQPGLRTVQGALEGAIDMVLRLAPGTARLTVAGRTDAGVHARGHGCHVDVEAGALNPLELCRRLGRLLPADVVVRRVCVAPAGFDARFSASWRRYAYRVCDDAARLDPLARRQVLSWPRPLDDAAMNTAAAELLGEHDFAAFCKRREGTSTTRDLRELAWTRADGLLTCRVVANAFCHNMVRSLVGCMVLVGEGRQDAAWAKEMLLAAVRDPRGLVVAPHGLTLEEVGYPPDSELAARALASRAPYPV